METIDKIVITILVSIPVFLQMILPVSSILGIKTKMWMGVIGLVGLMISASLGVIYFIWRIK